MVNARALRYTSGVLPSQASRLESEVIHDLSKVPEGPFHTGTLSASTLAGVNFIRLLREGLPSLPVYLIAFKSADGVVALTCVTELTIAIASFPVRIALCGNPVLSADCAIFTTNGVDRAAILVDVLTELTRTLRHRGMSAILLKEICAPSATVSTAGYFRLPLEPVLGIPVRWQNHDQYLASMTTHYRGLIKKAQRELANRGMTIQCEDDIAPISDDIYRLFCNVAFAKNRPIGQHPGGLGDRLATYFTNMPRQHFQQLQPAFFPAMKRLFPSETDVITIRNGDGRPVGCTVNMQDGDTFHSVYIGMERDEMTPYVYRALLFAKVQNAITRGLRIVHFGRTAVPTKADLGAVELDEACYCRLASGFMNPVARSITASIAARQEPFRPRSVFKVSPAATSPDE